MEHGSPKDELIVAGAPPTEIARFAPPAWNDFPIHFPAAALV